MDAILWTIPALPLAGFLFLLAFGRRLGDPVAGIVATSEATKGNGGPEKEGGEGRP